MEELLQVKLTQVQLIIDRGYRPSDFDNELMGGTLTNFPQGIMSAVRRQLTTIYVHPTTGIKLLVFYGWVDENTIHVGSNSVKSLFDMVSKNGVGEVVFIIGATLAPLANRDLSGLVSTRYQVFEDRELRYRPLNHILVPQHTLLSEEQSKEILRELGTQPIQLENIFTTDPIVKWYGWPAGRVVRIDRDDFLVDTLAQQSIQYRLIIAG